MMEHVLDIHTYYCRFATNNILFVPEKNFSSIPPSPRLRGLDHSSKENIQHFKTMHFFTVFYVSTFFPL
jgi:hypothetical protein